MKLLILMGLECAISSYITVPEAGQKERHLSSVQDLCLTQKPKAKTGYPHFKRYAKQMPF